MLWVKWHSLSICFQGLGFCTAGKFVDETIRGAMPASNPLNKKSESKSSAGCILCESVMMELRTMLSNNQTEVKLVNALDPGRFERNFRKVIFKLIIVSDSWGISCEIALRWMSLNLTDDKSTLVLVMAWCHQATSHYLNQCWPRPIMPYGIIRPKWVNMPWCRQCLGHRVQQTKGNPC